MTSLILYACPVGPLAAQIEDYLNKSQQACGPNAAHAYMPHCTLTGFFKDEASAVPYYAQAIETALHHHRSQRANLDINLPITVTDMVFRDGWHGLALRAEALKHIVTTVAAQSSSPTRQENLRLKDWLHLSLAYGFNPSDQRNLQQLASQLIDIAAPVMWELRLYERDTAGQWTCHRRWALQ